MSPLAAIGPAHPTPPLFSPSKCSSTTSASTPSHSASGLPQQLSFRIGGPKSGHFPAFASFFSVFLCAPRVLCVKTLIRQSSERRESPYERNPRPRSLSSAPHRCHCRLPRRESLARRAGTFRQLPYRRQDSHPRANSHAHG